MDVTTRIRKLEKTGTIKKFAKFLEECKSKQINLQAWEKRLAALSKTMAQREADGIDPRVEALKAIAALNNIIIQYRKLGLPLVEGDGIVEADFRLNTWFDATFGESAR